MKDSPSQFALRQWRAQFSNPVPLLILVAVAALLAIVGPFETGTHLTLVPRFGYWLVMVVVTYSIGLVVNTYLSRRLPAQMPIVLQVAVSGAITGLVITPAVLALNYATFAIFPSASEWPGLLAQFSAIALIISMIFQAIATSPPEDALREAARLPALLDRLPVEKRGGLVALSSEDHYTRIRTTQGEELVLIRLSDAIREAEPTAGLQVHRSHWVALGQVAGARRDGDRAILSLKGGGDIPVSRANVKAIKDAGLLPQ